MLVVSISFESSFHYTYPSNRPYVSPKLASVYSWPTALSTIDAVRTRSFQFGPLFLTTMPTVKPKGGSFIGVGTWCPGKTELESIRCVSRHFPRLPLSRHCF